MPSTPVAATPQPRPGRSAHERRPELDWLRMIIVLAIIPYHALLMFIPRTNTVIKHTITFPLAPILGGMLEIWGIALIFLLAGAATKFALDVRSPRTYVIERFLRLVPPLVLTAVAFTPLHAYYLLLANPGLIVGGPGSLLDPERLRRISGFFLQYWTSLFTTARPIVLGNMFLYLWFVPRLLVVSVICVPLFLYLRKRWPRRITRLAHSGFSLDLLLLVGGGLVAAAVVTLLEPALVNWLTFVAPLVGGRTQFSLDLVMFIYGYLLYANGRLLAVVRRRAYLTLGLAVLMWAVVFALSLRGLVSSATYSTTFAVFSFASTLGVWLLTLAVFGLALRYLTMTTSWQRYLTTASFPVFVLHTPLVIIAAFYLQVLAVPWFILLIIVSVATIVSAFAIYEYFVRRIPLTRFLFGLEAPGAAGGQSETPPPPSDHHTPLDQPPAPTLAEPAPHPQPSTVPR